MGDTSMSDATATSETGATTDTTNTETTNTETEKVEVDWKARARDWEKRAKANADAATKLTELEESQKTEAQKLADARDAAISDAAAARAEALRWRVAAKHGISDEDADLFLTGTDEETLTKQAARLAQTTSSKKNSRVVSREGTTTSKPAESDVREFARNLFGAPGDE